MRSGETGQGKQRWGRAGSGQDEVTVNVMVKVKVRVRVKIAWRGIFHYHLLTASQFFSDYLCIYRVLCGANS